MKLGIYYDAHSQCVVLSK